MSDEYSRFLAELQGAASEVLSCRIAGRESEEAREQLRRALERVRDAERSHRLWADRLGHAQAEASLLLGEDPEDLYLGEGCRV